MAMAMAKKQATKATTADATPKNVRAKWANAGVPLAKQISLAASSASWYRAALKKKPLKAGTKETYLGQLATYEAMLIELRAARDAEKAS